MPDSFPPPTWGPPFDERDLDVLLSGDVADTPLALRQVADALTALCAAPTLAELSGEAAALAQFRTLAGFRAAGLNGAARAARHAPTLELAALPPGRPGRRRARHRSSRRPGRPGGLLLAAGAAAVIVTVLAFAGGLSGQLERLVHGSAAGSGSSAHPSADGSGSRNTQAGPTPTDSSRQAMTVGSGRETPAGLPTSPGQSVARTYCRAYAGYFLHPQPHDTRSVELALLTEITKLAGGASKVISYCDPYVRDMFPAGRLWGQSDPPSSPPGVQDPSSGPGQSQDGSSGDGSGQSPPPSPPA